MEPNYDEEYERQLEEAINASLVNFTKSVTKPSNDSSMKDENNERDVSNHFEEEKHVLFKKSDLIEFNDDQPYSINRDVIMECNEEDHKEHPNEEIKGMIEELSENPPCTDLNSKMFSEYMDILDVNIIDQAELKTVLSVLNKIVNNICKDPNEMKYHKIKLNNK